MKSHTTQEINVLNKAVNEFQAEMKTQLGMNAAKGKRGWDVKSSDELIADMRHKTKIATEEDALDIANYAMFVYFALKREHEQRKAANLQP